MRKHIIYPKEEQLFLELAHLDELEIRFNFIDSERLSMFYFYGENYLFNIDKNHKCVYIRFDKIWEKLKIELNIDFDNLSFLLNKMIEKYFGLKGYSVI